jgi:signal transduction histidine kinase
VNRLRVQFLLFFVLLAGSLGFFVWNSYRQLGREERELWRGQAEKVYNQMQAAVSDFLTAEDRRPFRDYQSDSSPPAWEADGSRGVLGYFQIDPQGYFSTPQASFKERLKELTRSLTSEGEALKDKGYVELGEVGQAASKPVADLGYDREGEALLGARSKNVYPNPVQEQAVQLEKRKMASGKAAKASTAPKKEEAPPPPPAPAVTASAPAEPERRAEPERPPEAARPPSVQADPFQARLIGERHLLFYRKVWVDHRQYLQGFAVELEKFYSWLMDQSFANSDLPEFALARLELGDRALAQYGIVDLAVDGLPPFFERPLGYPLNLFDWGVYAARLPRIGTRWFLNALSGAVAFLATIGLYLIYRTASSQVAYSQKRQDFVSAVTHELKTPLTSIRMYAEMLEDGWAKDEDKRGEYYRQISKESGRLSRLIENVLQLARLEKKTYKLNLKKEVPTRDFEEICGELKRIAERQGFALSWTAEADLPPLVYDPEAVKQVYLSLLDNCLKFGAESADKSLEAALRREGDRVVWTLSDRGPGVPDKDLPRVFENFYRVENEMTRKTQGTGIGLAMARMLAHAMGATIRAANRVGGGLEVRLEFPATSGREGR